MLWDADGVLQHARVGWFERLTAIGGAGFADAVFEAELAPLRGERPFRDAVAEVLQGRSLGISADEVLALWDDIDVDSAAFELVGQVRAAGTPCYLATNQQDHRVRFMRETLGYDEHFDGAFYSSELGAMKPAPAYFEIVLEKLGIDAAATVFIDDNAANIETASTLGIRAHRHDPAAGVPGLRRILREAGVPTSPPTPVE